jgi:myo-inositol-1-phosphate synthase
MSKKVRVAIIGVGNCASSLVQGVEYYKHADPGDFVPGLMHVTLGGYHISDIEFSAAFDIDREKVGYDLAEAIFRSLNNTVKFADVPHLGVPVQRGMTLDGLGKYLKEVIHKAPGSTVNIDEVLKDTGTDVVLNYLTGGQRIGHRVVPRAHPRLRLRHGQLHAGLHRARAVLAAAVRAARFAGDRRRHQVAGGGDRQA